MSDFDRARSILRGVAADGVLTPEDGTYENAGEGVERLLMLVDTTVLATRATVTFDTGPALAMDISNRRILTLVPPVPADLTAEQATLYDIDELGPEDAASVGALLVQMFAAGSRFSVTLDPVTGEADIATGGLPPAVVAEALSLPEIGAADEPVPDTLATFALAIKEHLVAAVLIENDERAPVHGDGAEVEALADWAETGLPPLLSAAFPLAGSLETNGCLLFGFGDAKARKAVVVGRLGGYFIGVIDGLSETEILDAWRDAAR